MKALHYFKLIRLHNIFIACLCVLLCAYLIDDYDWKNISLCMLLIIFSMSFANSMNDILDLNSDKINHPKRVLNQNLISIKKAKSISYFSLFFCIFLSFFLSNLYLKIFFYIILFFLTSYNFFLKRIALIGNIVIGLLLSSVFIFTELVLANQLKILIIPSFLTFGLSFIRESIKDLHDYPGDKLSGMKTLPIIFGVKFSCFFISIVIFLSGIFFLYPYYNGIYGLKYFNSLLLFIEIPLLYSLFLLLNFQTIKTFKHLTNLYKILSFLGLFVIFLTK